MVLAGVRVAAPPGRESEPTEGVISCGHFTVRGAAVGDHPCSTDPRGNIKAGPAIVAILFGFFLASTGMAPSISRFLNSIADSIDSIRF